MNIAQVVILFVILCSAKADSGSGTISELSGEEDGNSAVGQDITSFMDEDVEKDLQSGDDDLLPDGLSSSGMERSKYDKNQHPAHPSTKTISMRREPQKNLATVAETRKPALSFNLPIDLSLGLQHSKKKIRRNDSDLEKPQQIKLKIIMAHGNLLKADNSSKHKQKEKRRYEYGRGPFNMKSVHVNNLIHGMEKLKKSKTDEELAKRIRKGTESLGVSFKTFEKLSGLWISILHRIWRVWKAKGARKMMSSIAKKIVAMTTQTLTPHFNHLFHNSRNKDHGSEAAALSKTHQSRKTFSLKNGGKESQIHHDTVEKPLSQDSKGLKTKAKTKGRGETGQEHLQKGDNARINGVQSDSFKKGFDKLGKNLTNLTRNPRKNHANHKGNEDKIMDNTRNQKRKQSHTISNGNLRDATSPVDSNSHAPSVGVEAPTNVKDKRLTSIKKNKVMNKRTELITTPSSTTSMILGDIKEYGLPQYAKGVLPNDLTYNQVKKLQDKVHHLEDEVTVLQTAVAGLADKVNHMERPFQEVSNVTQNEVIYGTTQASATTSPSHSIGSTPGVTPTMPFTTNQLSFPRQYEDRISSAQQPTPSPSYQLSADNQLISLGELSEKALENLRRQIASMDHPHAKRSPFVQQLQMEGLPTKQHNLTPTKPTSFPGKFFMKVLPVSTVGENVRKQSLIGDKSKESRHAFHQVVIPLETLYKMQAQEGIQVPDHSYDNVGITQQNAMLKDKTRKFHTAGSQLPQYSLGIDHITQDSPNNESQVRPIVDIIVSNSRTASILDKEMCRIPCKNGGKCSGRNMCQCPLPFYGNQCERFSLYDFINEKASKRTMSPIKKNSIRSSKLQQLSLNDLKGLDYKIRYNFINEKGNKGSASPTIRNSMRSPRLQHLTLKDLIDLGAQIRLSNGQAIRSLEKRSIK